MVVDHHGPAGKDGTSFPRLIANGQDVVEALAGKFVHVLGAMPAYVNSQFAQDHNGLRLDTAPAAPCAEDFKAVAGVVAQQALGHRAASGVASTENEDALLLHVPPLV